MPDIIDRPLIVFVSAAEASGDEHGANLIKALRVRLPQARFVGVAGERMRAAGCEVLADLTSKASMLMAPILRLGYYVRKIRHLQLQLRDLKPDIHVPVDSPAMNWHLAAAAKRIGVPVVYYVSPQVWAWAPWRVRKLARLTDRVACILPFEEPYLRDRGVNATFVGHPIYDGQELPPEPLPDLIDAWYSGAWRVALLPGSRPGEIHGHTRALLRVADAVRRRWPAACCVFAALTEEGARMIRQVCARAGQPNVEIAVGRTAALDVLSKSTFAVAGSGTVTLQAAYYGVPMVVFYRASLLLRSLHVTLGRNRSFVGTKHLSLVNILADQGIVPEIMPWGGRAGQLIDVVLETMDDLGYLHQMRREEQRLVHPLRVPPPGSASQNAADLVVKVLRERFPAQ